MFGFNVGWTLSLKRKIIRKCLLSVDLLFTCMRIYRLNILFVCCQVPPYCWPVRWSEAGLVAQPWIYIQLLGTFFLASVFFKEETFSISFGNKSLSTAPAGLVGFTISWWKLIPKVEGNGVGFNSGTKFYLHKYSWSKIFMLSFTETVIFPEEFFSVCVTKESNLASGNWPN